MAAIARRKDADSIVSLNLDERRAELTSEPPEPEGAEEEEEDDQEGPDPILDEATRIMRDWLGSKTTAQAG